MADAVSLELFKSLDEGFHNWIIEINHHFNCITHTGLSVPSILESFGLAAHPLQTLILSASFQSKLLDLPAKCHGCGIIPILNTSLVEPFIAYLSGHLSIR